MNAIELSWGDWRAVITVLREKGLPSMLQHADHIERPLEQNRLGEAMERLSLTDDVFLRSCNWSRVQLGDPAAGGLNAGRDSWDVWLDRHTGEGRLRHRTR